MKLEFNLDEQKIQEQIEEAINSKVAGLVWSMRSVVVDKLIEKYMPVELLHFKKESTKAFKEAVREAVKKEVKDYVDTRVKDAMKAIQDDFDKQTVKGTAFHNFPCEEEVEL